MSLPFPAGFIAFRREEIEDSIAARFTRQASRHPDRLALRFDDRSLTYRELAGFADRVAASVINVSGTGSEPVVILADQGIIEPAPPQECDADSVTA